MKALIKIYERNTNILTDAFITPVVQEPNGVRLQLDITFIKDKYNIDTIEEFNILYKMEYELYS